MLSDSALKVLYRLDQAGFEAYLVGGCVRDSLLGQVPKDFDVATNATPEQVRGVFRNARIIGRRFRIVHVRFGREIIEVTTFRGGHEGEEAERHAQQSQEGLLLRDNVWGSVDEDAMRRDFTVNALYYSIRDFAIHDWTGGIEDLEHRLLRLIGAPAQRYREDPVRMLRAVRFAARFDFALAEDTEAPLHDYAHLLLQIPPARLFEEVLKLFLSGYALDTFHGLRRYGLFAMLFPATEESFEQLDWALPMVEQALANTDARIRADKPVTPAFLYGALLWPAVVYSTNRLTADGIPPVPAAQQAGQQVIGRQLQHTSIPKRFSLPMREIWDMQLTLPRRRGKRPFQTLAHQRFRAAYDFLLLRESAGELAPGLGDWWTRFQDAGEETQRDMVKEVESGAGSDDDDAEQAAPESLPQPRRKPRRRRRRRGPPQGNE
ncbi:polynucleotide adenylyltransferase PcnB [Kushneria aurantia]|uniref:Poly(A) polymerase I n=1 Tax=Kushneria aurantia TaxID=504092 RepID=A0ABV6G696_9GAMM|nr:polynucleotide adenylyltransferase PcnB [Kushneria aurantia]